MKRNLRIHCLVMVCAVFLLIGLVCMGLFKTDATAAEKVFHWKFSSHVTPSSKTLGSAQIGWAQEVEKRSNGQIKVKMYWLDELCGPKEMMMAVKSRLAEVVGHTPSYTPGETPIWNAVYMPFICPSRLDQTTVVYNRLGRESKPFIEELNKFNCVYGGTYNSSGYDGLIGKKPVRNVSDLKGLRVRCMPDQGEILKQFGAIPMTTPVTEMYSALDSGIVDVVSHSRMAFHTYKVDEVSRYMTLDMNMGAMGTMYFINKDAWNELPDHLKKVVESVIDDYAAFLWDLYHLPELVAEADKVIKDRGIEVIHFPKAERAKLEAKADGVWEAYAKRTGNYENAKKAISEYIRIRDEVVAKYPQGVPGIKYK